MEAKDSVPGMQPQPVLSIIIPVYNEENCLAENVRIIERYLKTLPITSDILLVNDGSGDRTAVIGDRLAAGSGGIRMIHLSENRGKGFAVKTGILAATGQFRIFMDADLAVPVEFVGVCLERLRRGAEVVMGSRHLPGSCFKVPEGFLRTWLGKTYRKLTLVCFGLNVTDITCGLKGFSAKAAVDIFSRSLIDRWGYDAEVIFLARKLGYGIAEIPVEWYHSFNSAVRVGRDSVGTFVEMLKIGINYKKKRYELP
jgi:dolichyl-phosphate beta-glucosyltransferase